MIVNLGSDLTVQAALHFGGNGIDEQADAAERSITNAEPEGQIEDTTTCRKGASYVLAFAPSIQSPASGPIRKTPIVCQEVKGCRYGQCNQLHSTARRTANVGARSRGQNSFSIPSSRSERVILSCNARRLMDFQAIEVPLVIRPQQYGAVRRMVKGSWDRRIGVRRISTHWTIGYVLFFWHCYFRTELLLLQCHSRMQVEDKRKLALNDPAIYFRSERIMAAKIWHKSIIDEVEKKLTEHESKGGFISWVQLVEEAVSSV